MKKAVLMEYGIPEEKIREFNEAYWKDVHKHVVARRELFFIHWVVFVCGTPYTNRIMPCGGSNTFTFLYCVNVRHIEHTGFAAREVFKGLPQAAIWLDVVVLVLPQL